MAVSVVDVVRVRMAVGEPFVAVSVGMRDLPELVGRVRVLVMLVVGVLVGVLQFPVHMPVLVMVGREQHRARGHGPEGQ